MTEKNVLTEIREDIIIATLNRPEALNALNDDLMGILRESSLGLMQKLFPKLDEPSAQPGRGGGRVGGRKKTLTLGAQFKTQLASLIATLNATTPHFVRCMKPNDNKAGNLFDASRMLDQLRYAGLLEVCRIRKLGYPIRRDFKEFFQRFKCIFPVFSIKFENFWHFFF
mgnify:CR=1 FL=1